MSTWGLLRRVKLPTLVRSVTRARGQQLLQFGALVVLGATVFLGILLFSLVLFMALRYSPDAARLELGLLSTVYTGGFLSILVFGITTAMYTLYLAGDLRVLATMPIRTRTIFTYKFIETLGANTSLFAFFASPFLLGYGLATRASLLYYPTAVVVSVLILAIPTALSILLVIPVMRLLRPGRAREMLTAVWSLAGIAVWLGFQVMIRSTASAGAGRLQRLARSGTAGLPPGSWAGRTLAGAASGDWPELLGGLAPLLVVAVALYGVSLLVAEWAYLQGWAQTAETGRHVRGGGWLYVPLGWLPRGARAVAVKGLLTLPRDLRQLAGLGALALTAVAVTYLNRPMYGGGSIGAYVMVATFAAFSTGQSASRGIGGEGRAYWLYLASPLSTRQLLLGKWVAAFSVALVFVPLSLLAVSFLMYSTVGLVLGLVVGLAVAAVMTTYSLAAAALFPRFDWENPKNAMTTAGGFLIGGVLMGLMILGGLAVGLAFLLDHWLPFLLAALAAVAAWTLVAAVPGMVLLSMGERRLGQLEWSL